jgi:hypothetical protein
MRSGEISGVAALRRVRTRETDRRPDIVMSRQGKLTKQGTTTQATCVADTKCSEAQRKEGLYEVTTREDRDVGVGKSVTDRMHGRNLNTRANPNIVPPCTS